jgi:transcriptional regulator with XRE-family HTH domain
MNYCQGEKFNMNENNPRERIIQFRNFFGQTQEEFSKEIGMSQPNISKIESGLVDVSDILLYALMGRFAANPEWFKTGEGEMFLSPKEYLFKGLALLGVKKISEGFIEILKDPQFSEFHSYIAVNNTIKENLSDDLTETLLQVSKLWQHGDERTRRTLVQLVKALPEAGEQGKEDGKK